MARVRAHAGRQPKRPLPRRLVVRNALVASGVAPAPMLPTYDMVMGGPAERYFLEQALAEGRIVYDRDSWPTEAALAADPEAVIRDGSAAVYRLPDGTLAFVSVGHGWARVSVAAFDSDAVPDVMAAFRSQYPPSYSITEADGRVPVTFWTDGKYGPTARLRRIDASPWSGIDGNYSAAVAGELAELMAWQEGPERDGQLLAWLGEPGTGKTWALRALVSEWSPWAEFHYITDPDAFFVDNPSYMVDVLLADSYEAIDAASGDIVTEVDAQSKWRVLILEDTGELLSATAKEKYGQGLSRLLNVVDGMIGQGLRVLALVTTNDQLSDFHPAVTRPGRCASLLTFGPLTDDEARVWTGDPAAKSGTLAELYALRGTGLTPEDATDEEDEALAASVCAPATPLYALSADDIVAEIRAVAEDVNPLAVDYGETAWNPNTATVLWVAGDGTGEDEVAEVEERFLAIDGVDNFVHEHESMPDGWCDADIVYGGDLFEEACKDRAEAAHAELVALASQPLVLDRPLPPRD